MTKHRKLTQADLEYACSNDVQAACEQAGALRLGDLVLRMAEEILESRESRTAEHGTSATEGWTLTDEQLAGMALWDRDVILDERHRAVGAMRLWRFFRLARELLFRQLPKIFSRGGLNIFRLTRPGIAR